MNTTGITGILFILLTGIVSYLGLRDNSFLSRYAFNVDEILIHKDYKRLVTAGFLHRSWTHLLFNMLSLYFFSAGITTALGITPFILIYLGSMIGGNLFALYIHRNHGDYSAVGASGAISGIIFASIALYKGLEIGFFFTAIGIPGWLYGLLFVIVSIYGITTQKDLIGHEAHLGGGIIGLCIALTILPSALLDTYISIALLLIPTITFLCILLIKPDFMVFKKVITEQPEGLLTIDDRFNVSKADKEKEINALLDKINQKGLHKLSKAEKERLEELSR